VASCAVLLVIAVGLLIMTWSRDHQVTSKGNFSALNLTTLETGQYYFNKTLVRSNIEIYIRNLLIIIPLIDAMERSEKILRG
jgi:hypothetical protein